MGQCLALFVVAEGWLFLDIGWGVLFFQIPHNVSPVSPACRKRRLNGAVFRNNRIKRVARVSAWTGTLNNPTKCLWRWKPDCRFNFFFNPPAQCAVTYITEISLNVTFYNNLTHSHIQIPHDVDPPLNHGCNQAVEAFNIHSDSSMSFDFK